MAVRICIEHVILLLTGLLRDGDGKYYWSNGNQITQDFNPVGETGQPEQVNRNLTLSEFSPGYSKETSGQSQSHPTCVSKIFKGKVHIFLFVNWISPHLGSQT